MDEEFEDYNFGAVLYHYPEEFREDNIPPHMVAYFTEPKYVKRWLEDNDIIISKEESECLTEVNKVLPKDWYFDRSLFRTNIAPIMNKTKSDSLFIDHSNISSQEELEDALIEASEELNKFQGDNI